MFATQVNLVRDSPHNAIQYGNTKSHWMQYFHQTELQTSASSKAVIIIVVIVIVVLGIILTLLYYKRAQLTDFLLERRKARSGLEFSEYPTKLTANPDFMASLAPTWPERLKALGAAGIQRLVLLGGAQLSAHVTDCAHP